MKKRALCIVMAITLLAVGCGQNTAEAVKEEAVEKTQSETQEIEAATEEADPNEENVNLLTNGDFHAGLEHWGTFITKGGVAEFETKDNKGVMNITNSGSENYGVQLYYDGFPLKMGGVYELSFEISSTIPRDMEVRIQINGGDYHPYTDGFYNLTEEKTTITCPFTMEEGTDPAPRLCFNLGTPTGQDKLEAHSVTIENVILKITDASNIVEAETKDESVACNTNQIGYLPKARKTVVIRSENPGTTFSIKDETGNVVYTGKLSSAIDSVYEGEIVYQGEFTEYEEPGVYTVWSEDGESSFPFTIGEDVYDSLKKDVFHMLYLQRCGMELSNDLAGDFAHPVCHNTEAVVYGTNEKKEVNGGWHDAGDYGRYVVSGVETVEDLFLAYEDCPDVWNGVDADALDIPESGNQIPDILDEAKYELDWLLKMQDETTGGVYHKVTCLEFPGFIMPQDETEQLVLAPISTTATADFAAIMAKASVIYEQYDSAFARECILSAEKAWTFLEQNENMASYHNPEEILTGEYPDGQDKDEKFWASVELYKVTGDTKYKTFMEDIMDKYILHGFGWASMGSYGNIAYMSMEESLKNPSYEKKMKEEIAAKADKYLSNATEDGYHVLLGDGYNWGSNMTVCNAARQVLLAEEILGKQEYGNCAYDQLQYLLGENSLSTCFVTGYGSLSPKNPHHRPSMATGKLMTGMLVGGPDSALEDSLAKSVLADKPAAKCYIDSDQSYSTNEVTIYWNSPFLYLLSYEMQNAEK